MKQSTSPKRNEIRWTSQSKLDVLDFADDLDQLSHTQQQNANIVTEHSERLWMNIHRGNSKTLKLNSTSTVSVMPGKEAIEEVEHFKYMGSVVDTHGVIEANVKAGIDKARVTFLQLDNIWKSKVLSL